MGRAARDIFMELPEQDMVQPGDLRKEWLKQNGGTYCPLCPAIFRFEERGLLGLFHGDDFLVVGEDAQLRWLDDKRSVCFLHRFIKYDRSGR